MGVDKLRSQKRKFKKPKEDRSDNPYMQLLIRLYKTLSEKTENIFNQRVFRRLISPRRIRPVCSLKFLAKHMTERKDKIAVIVAKIVDDPTLVEFPSGLKIAALKFSKTARERITKLGGECWTLDHLATQAPTGNNCVLLRAPLNSRIRKHFGKYPGQAGSKAVPYVRSSGRKFERGRGRRASRGYKN